MDLLVVATIFAALTGVFGAVLTVVLMYQGNVQQKLLHQISQLKAEVHELKGIIEGYVRTQQALISERTDLLMRLANAQHQEREAAQALANHQALDRARHHVEDQA